MPIYGMRRGTEGAVQFGAYLRETRTSKGLTLKDIGDYLGVVPATASQIELGQRVLNERRLSAWAEAYGVGIRTFRSHWIKACMLPKPPITRARSTGISGKELEELLAKLHSTERARVQGYVEAIIEGRN